MSLTATIVREPTTADGTFGLFSISGEGRAPFVCHSLECPWKSNRRNVSCIPTGVYNCIWYISSRFGGCYLVENVQDRSGILIHPGNLAGDADMGLESHVEGCILLGLAVGAYGGQRAVLHSRPAIARLTAYANKEPFLLNVLWRPE